MSKIILWLKSHKALAAVIAVAIAALAYYFLKGNAADATVTRFVIERAEKVTLVSSVSGSGQIATSNQVDVKAKASGDVVSVAATAGQEVKAGTLLAQIDARDAVAAVRDAQANLQSAELSLQKLQKAADPLALIQAQNSIAQAEETKTKAESDLAKAYEDGFTDVSNAYLEFPGVMSGLDGLLFGNDLDRSQWNIDWYLTQVQRKEGSGALVVRNKTYDAYQSARAKFDSSFAEYRATSRSADKATIERLILNTYDLAKSISDAVKATNNFLDYADDAFKKYQQSVPAAMTAHQSSVDSFTGTINGHLASLLSVKQTIDSSKVSITSSERSLVEKNASLEDLKAGTDPLDIASQNLTVTQRKNSLIEAQAKLADYYVRAPFDGIVAKVNAKKGDAASSGAALFTFIAKRQIAEITLNEVDAAKVAVGQKATLSFDALGDLSLTGQVGEVDTLGTVSQGVVNYTVKISFDVQDPRVKPGMSVAATVIVASKPDVIAVPSAAVKNEGDVSYVEVPGEAVADDAFGNASGMELVSPLVRKNVTLGIANDTSVEITSGIAAGDAYVARTIVQKAATAAAQNGLFSVPGASRTGGNATRALTR